MQGVKFILGSVFLIIMFTCCLQTKNAYAQDDPFAENMKFGLAISGGVSLGSYEAGLNWVFVNHLKSAASYSLRNTDEGLRRIPKLVAVAGASAGSINTLMTALTWCMDENLLSASSSTIKNTITNNIFRETWENIGIDELLPSMAEMDEKQSSDFYKKGDLLFSRKKFKVAGEKIKELLKANIYRGDCSIPFAFTVTRTEPGKISTGGIEVASSRFVIPMRLISDPQQPGNVIIVSKTDITYDPFWGNTIYLPGTKRNTMYVVSPDDVIEAMQASSSFPIAFGSKELDYCINNRLEIGVMTAACPEDFVLRTDKFVDGGVFDNVPLGTTKALSEPRTSETATINGPRITYINLTPDIRRNSHKNDSSLAESARHYKCRDCNKTRSPLMLQLSFLSGAIETSENYELYNVLRSGEWNHQMGTAVRRVIRRLKKFRKLKPEIESRMSGTAASVICRTYMDPLPNFATNDEAMVQTALCLSEYSIKLNKSYRYTTKDDPAAIRTTLSGWLSAVATAIGENELAFTIKESLKDPGGERNILLSDRYPAITGDYLMHFGAFLERSFRTFDYYAGVYDAVNNIAKFRCLDDPKPEVCMGKEAEAVYRGLGIGVAKDELGEAVFAELAKAEHNDQQSWNWTQEKKYTAKDDKDKQVMIVLKSLQAQGQEASEPTFTAFIKKITNQNYPKAEPTLQSIIDKKDREEILLYYPLTSRASLRLKQIGNDEDNQLVKTAISVGMLTVNTIIDENKPGEWAPSTIPASAPDLWNAIPYEISTDLRNGGWVRLSWEPRINLSQNFAMSFKITPWYEDHYGELFRRFGQLDLLFSRKIKYSIFSSLGVGPDVFQAWTHRYARGKVYEHVGGSIYLGLFGDKLRITAGHRSANPNDYPAKGNNFYLTLGITDLPGILYWLK